MQEDPLSHPFPVFEGRREHNPLKPVIGNEMHLDH